MELVHPLAEQYAARFSVHEHTLLDQVHNNTQQTHKHAHLQSSKTQGKFLSFLSSMLQPTYILEIGTFNGYSALCLAEGLSANGELHTIELREDDAQIAANNFSISPKNKQIHLHIGNALEIIPQLNRRWDLIFIDADKVNYSNYYELVLPNLNDKGIIVADNVLFHGEVLADPILGKNAVAIHKFNQLIANDSRVEQVMLTVRDGLLLIKKKA